MSINLTSASIPPEDKAEFLQLCRRMLEIASRPGIGLSSEERRTYGVMGERTRTFTQLSLSLVGDYGQHFPPVIDVPEFSQDFGLHMDSQDMQRALAQVQQVLEDISIAAGFDAYQHALEVYNFGKALSSVPGVRDQVTEMGRLFERKRRKPSDPDTTPE